VAESLRWGILGTGNIARQFAAGVATSHTGELAAVGSRSASAADSFAQTFHVPQSFGSYNDVLKSEDVDVVYVALPNSMHREWTLAALRAGKHVLCEKPIASNAAEAEEMFVAADRAGKLLIEAFMYRAHPLTLAVIDAVRSGAIGELKLIRTSFCYRTRKIEGNIRFSRALTGGGLMDVGCYCINFSRLFAGSEPNRIEVQGHVHETGIDDLAVGTLSFPNGVVASFTCGMSVQADNTAYLCGSDGYIEIPVPWKPPKENAEFTIARSTPPRMDSAGAAVPTVPPREKRAVSAGVDLYAIEADDIAATILDGQVPRITRQDSIANMQVLDAMRRQLKIL
jgi:predicted dehydrogenase